MTTGQQVRDRGRLGRRLLPRGWAAFLVVLWTAALLVLLVLAWHLHRTGKATGVDAQVDGRLRFHLGGHRGLLSLLESFGSPTGVAVGSLALAGIMVGLRWGRGALLAVLAAPLAGVVTELLLKPWVGVTSTREGGLSFPSGHTSGAVGLALTAAILLLPHDSAPLVPSALRLLLGGCALAVALGTGIAMVANGYHRFSDVVGGVTTATVIVLAVAAALDTVRPDRT